ncbi:tRNA 2-selenouridine(34) synthase MnmH [Paenibacillus thalictri]|uniref:tRNA 2-selenouridine(34) synthase MnmH n=1 Tax=Paenibacillus thalictri TaxID=2527873 RepID=A0A4Q9DVU9_9BACL|nr:tRNA 2-selenouridine(34) synthase MnmH [Paenibacillus thalictri]TBL81184.1 tRNA 2-selenouridine(34) synthase MnmH [Paenibacillus thalictri]
MFQDISVEDMLALRKKGELELIDVRSSGEYETFTIPGSINIPFFTNEERAEIGTIYKMISKQAAMERGLEIISAKLPAFIKQFAAIPGRKAVYCWRGGMRSKTTATLLSLMNIHVYRLQGGIRAYRKWVSDTLDQFALNPICVVVSGYTGSGKTSVLQKLAMRGHPVLDLEAYAGHRGSIFGQIGLRPHNQKTFESLLLGALIEVQHKPYVLLEAESKRIGRCVMPDFLAEGKARGRQIVLEMPLSLRARHIIEDYKPHAHKQEVMDAFAFIKRRLHTPVAAEIEQHLLLGRYAEAVHLLLEHYYDPRYEHSSRQYDEAPEPVIYHASSVEEAADQIESYLQQQFPI